MKIRIYSFFIVLCALTTPGTGCVQSQPPQVERTLFNGDVTENAIAETVTIIESDVVIDQEFMTVYPFVFTELYVREGERELMRVTKNEGVVVEDGTTIPATVDELAAFGVQFGAEDFMYIIQLDSTGLPISEPLTINYDVVNQQWQMSR